MSRTQQLKKQIAELSGMIESFRTGRYNPDAWAGADMRRGREADRDFRNQERNAGLEHEQNNIQISINGKAWKVIPGKGYADSQEEWKYLDNMKTWAAKKSAATGKKWTVSLTGATPSNEGMTESLRPGEYHVWTVHFDDGTKGRIRVPSDEYDDDLIKAHYAKKGKRVVKIDYDWAVHNDLDEGGEIDKSHGSPYDCGGADSWYNRRYNPHKVVDGQDVPCETPEEKAAYRQGYKDNEDAGGHKDYRESVSEGFDGGGEYNDEVGMIKNDLHTIVRCTESLEKILEENENVAEWVQEKIAVSKSMMVTILDYVKSEHELGHVYSMNENINEWKKSTKAPVRPRNFVAKNATTGGAGAHKDKKKDAKQGKTKHKKPAEVDEHYANSLNRTLEVIETYGKRWDSKRQIWK
jgi:hypothetical protein